MLLDPEGAVSAVPSSRAAPVADPRGVQPVDRAVPGSGRAHAAEAYRRVASAQAAPVSYVVSVATLAPIRRSLEEQRAPERRHLLAEISEGVRPVVAGRANGGARPRPDHIRAGRGLHGRRPDGPDLQHRQRRLPLRPDPWKPLGTVRTFAALATWLAIVAAASTASRQIRPASELRALLGERLIQRVRVTRYARRACSTIDSSCASAPRSSPL
jgi:hypothetical protein